jgi:hypothetical protein
MQIIQIISDSIQQLCVHRETWQAEKATLGEMTQSLQAEKKTLVDQLVTVTAAYDDDKGKALRYYNTMNKQMETLNKKYKATKRELRQLQKQHSSACNDTIDTSVLVTPNNSSRLSTTEPVTEAVVSSAILQEAVSFSTFMSQQLRDLQQSVIPSYAQQVHVLTQTCTQQQRELMTLGAVNSKLQADFASETDARVRLEGELQQVKAEKDSQSESFKHSEAKFEVALKELNEKLAEKVRELIRCEIRAAELQIIIDLNNVVVKTGSTASTTRRKPAVRFDSSAKTQEPPETSQQQQQRSGTDVNHVSTGVTKVPPAVVRAILETTHDKDMKIQHLNEVIKELHNDKHALTRSITKLRGENQKLATENKYLDSQLDEAAEELNNLQEKLELSQHKLATAQQQLKATLNSKQSYLPPSQPQSQSHASMPVVSQQHPQSQQQPSQAPSQSLQPLKDQIQRLTIELQEQKRVRETLTSEKEAATDRQVELTKQLEQRHAEMLVLVDERTELQAEKLGLLTEQTQLQVFVQTLKEENEQLKSDNKLLSADKSAITESVEYRLHEATESRFLHDLRETLLQRTFRESAVQAATPRAVQSPSASFSFASLSGKGSGPGSGSGSADRVTPHGKRSSEGRSSGTSGSTPRGSFLFTSSKNAGTSGKASNAASSSGKASSVVTHSFSRGNLMDAFDFAGDATTGTDGGIDVDTEALQEAVAEAEAELQAVKTDSAQKLQLYTIMSEEATFREEKTKSELLAAQTKLTETQTALASAQSRIAEADTQLEGLKLEMGEADRQLQDVRAELLQAETALTATKDELATRQSELDEANGRLAQTDLELQQLQSNLADANQKAETCRIEAVEAAEMSALLRTQLLDELSELKATQTIVNNKLMDTESTCEQLRTELRLLREEAVANKTLSFEEKNRHGELIDSAHDQLGSTKQQLSEATILIAALKQQALQAETDGATLSTLQLANAQLVQEKSALGVNVDTLNTECTQLQVVIEGLKEEIQQLQLLNTQLTTVNSKQQAELADLLAENAQISQKLDASHSQRHYHQQQLLAMDTHIAAEMELRSENMLLLTVLDALRNEFTQLREQTSCFLAAAAADVSTTQHQEQELSQSAVFNLATDEKEPSPPKEHTLDTQKVPLSDERMDSHTNFMSRHSSEPRVPVAGVQSELLHELETKVHSLRDRSVPRQPTRAPALDGAPLQHDVRSSGSLSAPPDDTTPNTMNTTTQRPREKLEVSSERANPSMALIPPTATITELAEEAGEGQTDEGNQLAAAAPLPDSTAGASQSLISATEGASGSVPITSKSSKDVEVAAAKDDESITQETNSTQPQSSSNRRFNRKTRDTQNGGNVQIKAGRQSAAAGPDQNRDSGASEPSRTELLELAKDTPPETDLIPIAATEDSLIQETTVSRLLNTSHLNSSKAEGYSMEKLDINDSIATASEPVVLVSTDISGFGRLEASVKVETVEADVAPVAAADNPWIQASVSSPLSRQILEAPTVEMTQISHENQPAVAGPEKTSDDTATPGRARVQLVTDVGVAEDLMPVAPTEDRSLDQEPPLNQSPRNNRTARKQAKKKAAASMKAVSGDGNQSATANLDQKKSNVAATVESGTSAPMNITGPSDIRAAKEAGIVDDEIPVATAMEDSFVLETSALRSPQSTVSSRREVARPEESAGASRGHWPTADEQVPDNSTSEHMGLEELPSPVRAVGTASGAKFDSSVFTEQSSAENVVELPRLDLDSSFQANADDSQLVKHLSHGQQKLTFSLVQDDSSFFDDDEDFSRLETQQPKLSASNDASMEDSRVDSVEAVKIDSTNASEVSGFHHALSGIQRRFVSGSSDDSMDSVRSMESVDNEYSGAVNVGGFFDRFKVYKGDNGGAENGGDNGDAAADGRPLTSDVVFGTNALDQRSGAGRGSTKGDSDVSSGSLSARSSGGGAGGGAKKKLTRTRSHKHSFTVHTDTSHAAAGSSSAASTLVAPPSAASTGSGVAGDGGSGGAGGGGPRRIAKNAQDLARIVEAERKK